MTVIGSAGGGEGDAGEFAAEVGGVALAVLGVVQDGVDVVEDVPLGDGGVVVVGAELFEGPVGDVLAAVGAVFGVGVEGEALGAAFRLIDGDRMLQSTMKGKKGSRRAMRDYGFRLCRDVEENLFGIWYLRSIQKSSK